ncbi:MAG: hypothetical protein WC082_15075 [Victivallales bacterium]
MEYKRNECSVLDDYINEWAEWMDAGGYDHAVVGDWPRYAFQVNVRPPGNYVDWGFLMNNRTWGPIVLEDYLFDLYEGKPIKNNAST